MYERKQTNHPHHFPIPEILLLEPLYKGTIIKAIQLIFEDFSYLDTSALIHLVPFSKKGLQENEHGQPEPFSTMSKIELTMS